MERVILHCDANFFYAAVECLYHPDLRDQPVAVCGDASTRHGIVLTKNTQAKAYGIKTGEAIWQARQKCPGLVCLPPNFPLYMRFSRQMRALYTQYSDRVESFGLDECWVDLTGSSFVEGRRIADEIRFRAREELGLTLSVGVANNKIFAKLGSDMKKPDATTVILPRDVRRMVYPLPVGDLLFVGPSTRRRLASVGILTIGDLAQCEDGILQKLLGKNGPTLKAYAAGLDQSPVLPADYHTPAKSVSNSATPPHDLQNMDDVRCLFYLLAESVAARLREDGCHARCVSISVRDTNLITHTCQTSLSRPTYLTDDIAQAALELFKSRFANGFPYRSAGIACTQLTSDSEPVQLDFTGDEARRVSMENLEHSIDGLRRRYGHQIIQRGVVLTDSLYADIRPAEDFQPFRKGQI